MSLNFCKGCSYYFIQDLGHNMKHQACMIGILPNIEPNREDCERNQRDREIKQYCGKILLALKPKYAELIYQGKKLMEFRKKIWNKDEYLYTKAIIYESHPISKITGEFTIGLIDNDGIDDLWEKYHSLSGLNETEFRNYYSKSEKGYAIEVLNPLKYEKPLKIQSSIPQNFIYYK